MSDLSNDPGFAEFAAAFHEEHLEEIGFLLDQRIGYFADPEIPWPRVADLERRIAAHLTAVTAWGPPALDLARASFDDETLGSGAIHVVASLGTDADREAVARALAAATADRIPIVAGALVTVRGPDLGPVIAPLLAAETPEVRAAAIDLLGLRDEGPADAAEPLLHDRAPIVRVAAARALARRGRREATTLLEVLRDEEDPEGAALLVMPLLALGSIKIVEHCRRACRGEAPSFADLALALAIGGEASDAPLVTRAPGATPQERARALGILGAPSGIPALLSMLSGDDQEAAIEAARALARITGGGPRERATITLPPDEDEPDAPPRTKQIERPSTRRDAWEAALRDLRAPSAAVRLRGGAPLDAGACIEEIGSPHAPIGDRARAACELRRRARDHVRFEPDGIVAEQRAAVARWRAWWAASRPQ